MKPLKQAKRYARMFLNSVGEDAAGKSLEELAVLSSLMQQSNDFMSLVSSPMFSKAERETALTGLQGTLGLSDATVKFVLFLSVEGAAYGLTQVLDKAAAIYAESMGKVKATVYTPDLTIGKRYEDRIRQALGAVTSREVDLDFEEDSSLIGGVLIKVGSTMLDGSIKGQLRLLKDELIQKG